MAVWLVPAGLAVIIEHRRPTTSLFALYAVLSALTGFAAMGGAGADYNYLFDLTIAQAILVGIFFAALSRILATTAAPGWAVQSVLVLSLAMPLAEKVPGKLLDHRAAARAAPATELSVRQAVNFIGDKEGPAMCESLALCYWAGKDFSVDFFNTGQKMIANIIDQKTLVDLIEEHHFAVGQIDHVMNGVPVTDRLPQDVDLALVRHYEVAHIDPHFGVLLVPKTPEAGDRRLVPLDH